MKSRTLEGLQPAFSPRQGRWTEEQYLALDTNQLVELVDGRLEVLAVPDLFHQSVLKWLFQLLNTYVVANASGEVHFAPLRVRLFPDNIREPDLVYVRPERIIDRKTPPRAADLVMEIVSEGKENRDRDYKAKKEAYAKAGITEYWIVDPEERRITVLTLDGMEYRTHGEFVPGQKATSAMFPEFSIDVLETFKAGDGNHLPRTE